MYSKDISLILLDMWYRSANGDQARKVAPSVHVATSKPRQKSPSPPPKGISKDSEQTYSDLYRLVMVEIGINSSVHACSLKS